MSVCNARNFSHFASEDSEKKKMGLRIFFWFGLLFLGIEASNVDDDTQTEELSTSHTQVSHAKSANTEPPTISSREELKFVNGVCKSSKIEVISGKGRKK